MGRKTLKECVFFLLAITAPWVASQTPDYASCTSLESFSVNCLDFMQGHDDDAMCVDFESSMSAECTDQVNGYAKEKDIYTLSISISISAHTQLNHTISHRQHCLCACYCINVATFLYSVAC
jgi:hypothetical protein